MLEFNGQAARSVNVGLMRPRGTSRQVMEMRLSSSDANPFPAHSNSWFPPEWQFVSAQHWHSARRVNAQSDVCASCRIC